MRVTKSGAGFHCARAVRDDRRMTANFEVGAFVAQWNALDRGERLELRRLVRMGRRETSRAGAPRAGLRAMAVAAPVDAVLLVWFVPGIFVVLGVAATDPPDPRGRDDRARRAGGVGLHQPAQARTLGSVVDAFVTRVTVDVLHQTARGCGGPDQGDVRRSGCGAVSPAVTTSPSFGFADTSSRERNAVAHVETMRGSRHDQCLEARHEQLLHESAPSANRRASCTNEMGGALYADRLVCREAWSAVLDRGPEAPQ